MIFGGENGFVLGLNWVCIVGGQGSGVRGQALVKSCEVRSYSAAGSLPSQGQIGFVFNKSVQND